jgi:hypothetical protein
VFCYASVVPTHDLPCAAQSECHPFERDRASPEFRPWASAGTLANGKPAAASAATSSGASASRAARSAGRGFSERRGSSRGPVMDSPRGRPLDADDSIPVLPTRRTPASPTVVQIDRDVMCRRCHYNLRGLAVDGNCPECGSPVGASTNPTREPLPLYYRYSRLILLTSGVASAILIVAACILRDDHRIALWYLSQRVGELGLMLALPMCLIACGFLLISGRARRDALVWVCLLLIPLTFIGLHALTRARE